MVLQIRDEQNAALLEASRKSFEVRTQAYLRANWSRQTKDVPDDTLREFIRNCRSRAESYNIEREVDVVRYIEVCVTLGEDFDKSPDFPWARRILHDSKRDGEMKMSATFHPAIARLPGIDSAAK